MRHRHLPPHPGPGHQLPRTQLVSAGRVLGNTFFVPKERTEAFLALFRRQAEFMKAQPGFVSPQMHMGTADSQLLMNVAVWESTEALATVFGSPEFQRMAAEFPDDIVSYPHIFEQIDV
ncbi:MULTISPECIES: antibiotic biosynthesis monooxygenase family protein [unclassified Streptomyces]|uniref:antibiotic biosynthesis monooxygenase family protein n=1 Tax=unclassified Streptomyces TaxID=2593676 RepID=UPI002E80C4FB|nr:antibiotic biosynthesis monooxygenase family protein [Streptomyces sp. NBC_00589]WTI33646.1 antibiotic biosynthesis monooxygenase [Streptomyces sp. NBC_00775]WUB32682.1 antibiotic biosynthesis monooxygenase [Streptomyces sp. NBC_00589]